MTYIVSNIQDGYLLRKGWRGRWLTCYYHQYNGNSERTERFHSHPWKLAISFVLKGRFVDAIELRSMDDRGRFSFAFYTKSMRHRLLHIEPGTKSLFFGFFRTQESIPSADVKCREGYCHYSEISGDITERK